MTNKNFLPMKNKLIFAALFIIIALGLFSLPSCGEKETTLQNDTIDSVKIDYKGMRSYSLKDHGLNTTLMIPEELTPSGDPFPVEVVKGEDGFTWRITAGPSFEMVIEEVDGEGNYIQRKKEALKNSVFTVEYLIDEPDKFMYKALLPNEAGQRDYYHVYGVVKIDGAEYIIMSNEAGEFSEVQAKDMLKTIYSISEKAL